VQGSEYRITVLCIATLHDDLLKQVRAWARMGYNAQNIQAELDYKFGGSDIYHTPTYPLTTPIRPRPLLTHLHVVTRARPPPTSKLPPPQPPLGPYLAGIWLVTAPAGAVSPKDVI